FVRCSGSRRVPCESLNAPKKLPKEGSRQVALGELQDEVPGMSDQPAARLEEPLLQTRQRPALDGDGEDEPAQQVTEVVGDDPQEQAHLVSPEAATGEARPVSGFLAFLDPLLGRPALVVVALRVENEERMIADRLEMAVVRRLLLRAVDQALRT